MSPLGSSTLTSTVRLVSLVLVDLVGNYTPPATVISQGAMLYPLYNSGSVETHLTLLAGDWF